MRPLLTEIIRNIKIGGAASSFEFPNLNEHLLHCQVIEIHFECLGKEIDITKFKGDIEKN